MIIVMVSSTIILLPLRTFSSRIFYVSWMIGRFHWWVVTTLFGGVGMMGRG